MGPWFVGKKNTSEDGVDRRQGPRPVQGPSGAARPQEEEDREGQQGPARQMAQGAPPQGRAVARSLGRPAPSSSSSRRPAAGVPEGSSSQHATQPPPPLRPATGAAPPLQRHAAGATSQEPFIHWRVRPSVNESNMGNKRDKSPVKHVSNARPILGNNPPNAIQPRTAERMRPQPGAVSARGGGPRPSRPPAPVQRKRPNPLREQQQQNNRPAAGPSNSSRIEQQPQPLVTSASTERNATAAPKDDGVRSGQQISSNSRHYKGRVSHSQSDSHLNTTTSDNTRNAEVPGRTNRPGNNNQQRLPNIPNSRPDVVSRPTPQKSGHTINRQNNRNKNGEGTSSSQRTNSHAVNGPDANRVSSSSSGDDSSPANTDTANAKNKQKHNNVSRRDNTNVSRTSATNASGGHHHAIQIEASVHRNPTAGNDTGGLSRDNPSGDNLHSQYVERVTADAARDRRHIERSQPLRQRPASQEEVGGPSRGPPVSDQLNTRVTSRMPAERDRSDRPAERIAAPSSAGPTAQRNSLQNISSSNTAGTSQNTVNTNSREVRGFSTSAGMRERPGGVQSSNSRPVTNPASSNMDRENATRTRPVVQESSTGRTDNLGRCDPIVQRSQVNRDVLNSNRNDGVGSQRTTRGNDPTTSSRNSRITNRSEPQSANAPSAISNSRNNAQDRVMNVLVPAGRREVTGANTERVSNVESNGTRPSVQNTAVRPTVQQARARVFNNAGNNIQLSNSGNMSSNRVSVQTRNNGQARSANSGASQARPGQQSGAVLDPSQLNIDVIDHTVPDQPPPYSTLDVHRPTNRRNTNNGASVVVRSNPVSSQVLPDILNSLVHPPPRQNESRSTRRGVVPPAAPGHNQTQSANAITEGRPGRPRPRTPPRGTTRLESASAWECLCTKWHCLRCLTIVTTFRFVTCKNLRCENMGANVSLEQSLVLNQKQKVQLQHNKADCTRCSITKYERRRSCCNWRNSLFDVCRWILVTLALLGVCCVLTGIILGALHMTIGSSFLTLSLMFIGKLRSSGFHTSACCVDQHRKKLSWY